MAASRKFAAVATLRSLLLIGALLLAMASPAAVSEEDATIGRNTPFDRAPAPPPANNDGAAFRASSSPAISSVDAPLPSAPKGSSAAIPPEAAPAPQPQLRPRRKESDENFYLILLIILIVCCVLSQP